MKNIYLTIIVLLSFTTFSNAQMHFEQGFFERDLDYTKRISREFRPTIYNGMIVVSLYNHQSPFNIAMYQPPVETIQKIDANVKLKTFTSDGDVIDGLIYKELIARLINRDNRIIAIQREQYDLSYLEHLNEEEVQFSFDVTWDLKEILFLEVRLEDRILYKSPSVFRLSDVMGVSMPSLILD